MTSTPMSPSTPPPPPPPPPAGVPALGLDVSGTAPVPFWRLALVEFRKSYDTRAGKWLLITIGSLIALLEVIALIAINLQDQPAEFTDFTGNVFIVSLVLVPMLPILLVTSEWTQRSAMVSFALEPRRLRVVLAKLAVSVVLALAAVALMFVVATVCTAICTALQPDLTAWHVEASFVFLGAPLAILATTVFGFAVATMLLNTPGAIVLFLLTWFAGLPILLGIAALIHPFDHVVPWIALQLNVLTLGDGLPSTASDWAHLLVSLVFWVCIPLAFGLSRIVRAEVK